MTDSPSTTEPSLLYKFCRTVSRITTTLWFDLQVTGLEHIPAEGGALILTNHQSYLDPVLVGVRIKRPVAFLAKSELFEPVLLSWLIRKLNAFPVKQGAGDIGAIRETIAKLNEGYILNVFPEGTRTLDGQLQEIQGGFALILRKTDVPVIPCIIDGSFRAMKPGNFFIKPTKIRVVYGPPLNTKGLKGAEIVAMTDRVLRGMLEEMENGKR